MVTICSLVILFPILIHFWVCCSISGSNCCFLTHIQVKWSGIPFSLRIFQFVVIHTVRGFPIVKEADVFLEFSGFLHDTVIAGNLISGSSAFSKPSLYIWKFLVHLLLKPCLKDFEHKLTSMRNKHDYKVVEIFFGIALLWNWNKNLPFLVLWPLLSFPDFLTYWVQNLIASF